MKWKRSKKAKEVPSQESEKDIDVSVSEPLTPADISKDVSSANKDCIVMHDDAAMRIAPHEYDHDDVDDDDIDIDDDDELDGDCHSPICSDTMEERATLIAQENSLTDNRFTSSVTVPPPPPPTTTVVSRPGFSNPPMATVH